MCSPSCKRPPNRGADPRCTVGGVRDPITALERAIQSLPAATRAAMLDRDPGAPDRLRRLHRRPRRHLPDARRAPPRRPRDDARLRALLGRLHARQAGAPRHAARAAHARGPPAREPRARVRTSRRRSPSIRRQRAASTRRSARGGSARRADPVDEPQQVQRRERLGEEEVRAGVLSAALHDVAGVAGQHHDRRAPPSPGRCAAAGRPRSRSGAACRCPGRRSPAARPGRARPPPCRRPPPAAGSPRCPRAWSRSACGSSDRRRR